MDLAEPIPGPCTEVLGKLAKDLDVAGVKMPFRIISTWLDGKATTDPTQIQPNVPIDAARFGNHDPPAPPSK